MGNFYSKEELNGFMKKYIYDERFFYKDGPAFGNIPYENNLNAAALDIIFTCIMMGNSVVDRKDLTNEISTRIQNISDYVLERKLKTFNSNNGKDSMGKEEFDAIYYEIDPILKGEQLAIVVIQNAKLARKPIFKELDLILRDAINEVDKIVPKYPVVKSKTIRKLKDYQNGLFAQYIDQDYPIVNGKGMVEWAQIRYAKIIHDYKVEAGVNEIEFGGIIGLIQAILGTKKRLLQRQLAASAKAEEDYKKVMEYLKYRGWVIADHIRTFSHQYTRFVNDSLKLITYESLGGDEIIKILNEEEKKYVVKHAEESTSVGE
jgi:hypothetical protein